MRYLCFLLAAFFLVLDLEICNDGIPVQTPAVSAMASLQKDKKTQHQDQCPPSCGCNCCCIFSLIQFRTMSLPQLTRASRVYYAAVMEVPVHRAINVWQPPKLNERA